MHSDPTPPPRLKHGTDPTDPLAKALSDESLAVGAYDMDGLRGRVLDAARGAPPTTPTPSGTAWWKVAVLSGITASLVTFGLVQLMPGGTEPVPTPSTETFTPALRSIPADETSSRVVPHAIDASDPSDDGAAALSEPRVPPTPEAVLPPPSVDESSDAPDDADVADVARDGAAAADSSGAREVVESPESPSVPKTSPLAAELADYNQAVDFDARQDWAAALAAWDVYFDRWPDGRLRTEARLGRLRAQVGVDQPSQVERLAGELLATPGLRAQRDDLVLTRAEALVKLDRCDEARGLVADRRRSDPGFDRVQAVRSTCRRR